LQSELRYVLLIFLGQIIDINKNIAWIAVFLYVVFKRNSSEKGYCHEKGSVVGQKGEDKMKRIFTAVLLSFLVLAPLSVEANICNALSKWRKVCRDPANGPDIGTAEWIACRERGGCNYP